MNLPPGWLLSVLVLFAFRIEHSSSYDWEFQRYDGWYNNLAHPDWGTAGSRLYRQVPSSYMDGVYMINDSLPSARLISDIVFKGPDGLPNRRNVTTMLAFFSQVVAYEVMQASDAMCPLEMHKIPVKTCDPVFDTGCAGSTMMPFIRAKYDMNTGLGLNSPREQINQRTSWIDASFLYSTQEPWVHALRSFVNGTLREGPMPNYPPFNAQRLPLVNPPPPQVHRLVDPERLFMLGDARVNENPALLSFGLMLFRWHNVQANRLKVEHPDWTDEQLFQRARRWVIGTLQNIIMYEFLPALLGEATGDYQGYNAHLPPGVSHLFAAAAFRYPHTLVPPGMFLRNATCHYQKDEGAGGYSAIRLCNTWWNSQEAIQRYSMDAFVLGMASQIAERDDNIVVADLRDFVFGPIHFSRRDLVALTIMRGRDNGLADYNNMRKAFGFEAVRNWSDINPQMYAATPEMIDRLAAAYNGDLSKLDFYVGGILESSGDTPGKLFTRLIKEQFERIRHADRFWFENKENGLFSDSEIQEIYNLRLSDIIVATTQIQREHLQRNVFFWHSGDPCPQPYQLNSTHLEPCIPFMRYDHFMGNEVAFIYTCIVLGAIPLACIGIGYWIIKRRRKLSGSPIGFGKSARVTPIGIVTAKSTEFVGDKTQAGKVDGSDRVADDDHSLARGFKNLAIFTVEKTGGNAAWVGPAIEWLHENYSRSVTVILDQRPAVHLTKRRGGLLRCVSLEDVYSLVMYKSDAGFIRLELPRDYDMVLRFESYSVCEKFTVHLDEIMRQHNKQLRISYTTTERLLATAETKEKRQQKLEHFFREAYAKAFRFLPMSNRHTLYDDVSESVLRTTLTRAEFADALGMQENDLFIQRMFACIARTNGEKICFQDFLDTVIKFATGTMEEKLKIIYFLCDRDNNGLVDREEFCQFLRSIVTAAGTPLSTSDQDELLHQILYNAGIPKQKPYLTRKDLDAILTDVTAKNKPVGLHLKGRKQTYFNNNYLAEQESINSFSVPAEESSSILIESYRKAVTWLEDYRQHVTCLLIFFMLTWAAFFERFWHYSTMSEHRDLRRVMGYGIAVTRGAAAAISFNLALILLTICRNVITKLRETPLNHYIPFDAAISFHKVIGVTVGFFAVAHTIGHCINFYHVSTQDLDGLSCLFQEAVFSSDFQPSITYWFFGTVTGITGILLVAVMSIMYVFAAPSVMHNAYHAFRITHFLNVLLYALTIAHGLPRLLDSPTFWKYIIGPMIVLVIDRLISLRQEYKRLEIVEAQLLPSDVTYVKFKRPRNFNFRSGQWVRIRCPAFSCNFNEWHAFSLASAPQDPTLEIYVKAQGPWTWKLRHEIKPAVQRLPTSDGIYPVLHMDGPYGGGNQEWSNYEVAVMVGGGIGVTPYASILTDLVTATSGSKFSDVACKKVYFLWICPTQKNFEWFIEVLRRVEEADVKGVLETHIYITQFFHKFDLRTTMLYICEKHFRVNQGRSMFTNLKAINHFGRPILTDVLKHVQQKHENSRKIGVFSCGPRTLNRSVQAACEFVNGTRRKPNFIHRYETF